MDRSPEVFRDEALFEIWNGFKPINADYYYITGIMGPVYSLLLNRYSTRDQKSDPSRNSWATRFHDHQFNVLTYNNNSYRAKGRDFGGGILDRLNAWYPRWFASAS